MIVPMIMPVRTGSFYGGCRPFSSISEMVAFLCVVLALILAILSVCYLVSTEIDSIVGRIVIWAIGLLFCGAFIGIFFMCL